MHPKLVIPLQLRLQASNSIVRVDPFIFEELMCVIDRFVTVPHFSKSFSGRLQQFTVQILSYCSICISPFELMPCFVLKVSLIYFFYFSFHFVSDFTLSLAMVKWAISSSSMWSILPIHKWLLYLLPIKCRSQLIHSIFVISRGIVNSSHIDCFTQVMENLSDSVFTMVRDKNPK